MTSLIVILGFIAITIFVIFAMNSPSKQNQLIKQKKPIEPIKPKKSNQTPIKSSYLMTNHEKAMFGELKKAVPECHIFVQVALGAILWTSSYGTRNRFSQKIADFVVTNNNFQILAVIELDDSSHNGKEEKDAERDAMVREAGYKALRYPVMPPVEQLRSDILS